MNPTLSPTRRSAGAPAAEHGGDGFHENLEIEAQRPVVDVLQVEFHPLLEVDRVPARDLPEAREAGADAEAAPSPGLVLRHFGGHRRTGTHEAHVAAEDVPHLGEFVEA